ncbi:uncharacterized protein DSM5745_07818 [Aspergillus mulundensis]|uniref:Uncharacterized protein n=1 Tax=Aspergillus mulundensis TaxID=1810919 RepID=A0A3D8RFA8_9EURO|nr:Uncharacterized protein DSM5745_07818 [Aspergillus mulundensis]RDW72646.1 Uncharacterized protein DSM5745_07818 [Aspergillus mulundensis]
MSSPQKITSFFKRPKFAQTDQDTRLESPGEDPAPQSSPLTELSSQLLPSDVTIPDTPGGPSAQLKRSLLLSAGTQNGNDEAPRSSFQTPPTGAADHDPAPQSSFQSSRTGTPFSSSQRITKNGKQFVTNSDSESDSIGSIDSHQDILSMFLPKATPNPQTGKDEAKTMRDRPAPNVKSVPLWKMAPPKYKNTLDNLVIQTVDDNEIEARITKIKASIEAEAARNDHKKGGGGLNEEVLASALDNGNDDSIGLQRIINAVRRTEALELKKTWSFFDLETELPPTQEFPRECVCPGTYLAVLRDPESRERPFYSGIIDYAISKDLIADELVRWIFFAIPSENRDNLRHAYCRALKRLSPGRMKSLIQPEDIDTLFWHMSARPEALTLTDLIVPDTHLRDNAPESQPPHYTALLSVLDFFREAAARFADDTRNRILHYLLRLPLDTSLTQDFTLCSAIEQTITAVLDETPAEFADELATNICYIAHSTLQDAELQSRLLDHIAPANDWIATLRRRLAYIFLTKDFSVSPGSQHRKAEVNRINNILKHPRFNVKRWKKKGAPQYDYAELISITTFLEIIIDSGWSETQFPDRRAEDEYNKEVDVLADRIKKIFSAIEDSGASHLMRTLAKGALESLHYRVLYSVRTKPREKNSLFGKYDPEEDNQTTINFPPAEKKEKKVTILSNKPET